MPAPSLPQEIFDKITDQYAFGLDSLRPIKTLSLASRRHFLQRCRFHIFGSLTIVTDVSPRTMAMLESSPSLLTHVRKLSLVFDISNYQGPTRMDRAQRISQVIDKITGLVTLSIIPTMNSVFGPKQRVEAFQGPMKDSMARLFTLPTLGNLRISGFYNTIFIQIPHHPLHLNHLQVLWLDRQIEFLGGNDGTDDTTTRFRRLRSLISGGEAMSTIDCLLRPCLIPEYPNLVQLNLVIKSVKAHINALSIVNNSPVLEKLQLDYSRFHEEDDLVYKCYSEMMMSGRTIPSIQSLYFVKLDISLGFDRPSIVVPDLAPNMISLLLCTNPQPSLTVVSVLFQWGTPPVSVEQVRAGMHFIDGMRLAWCKLDECFSDKTFFPKLCAIAMEPGHHFPSTEGFSVDDWNVGWRTTRRETKDALPRTRDREGIFLETGDVHCDPHGRNWFEVCRGIERQRRKVYYWPF